MASSASTPASETAAVTTQATSGVRVSAVSLEAALSRALEGAMPRLVESLAAAVRQPPNTSAATAGSSAGMWPGYTGTAIDRSGQLLLEGSKKLRSGLTSIRAHQPAASKGKAEGEGG